MMWTLSTNALVWWQDRRASEGTDSHGQNEFWFDTLITRIMGISRLGQYSDRCNMG